MITNFIESIDESPTFRADASKVSIEDFNLIKVLGKGTYGKVKLANDKRTGKQVGFFH